MNSSTLYQSFNLKCFGLLSSLLGYSLKKFEKNFPLSPFVNQSLSLMYEALKYAKESLDPENYLIADEFIVNNFILIEICLSFDKLLLNIIFGFKDLAYLLYYGLIYTKSQKIRNFFKENILKFDEKLQLILDKTEFHPDFLLKLFINTLINEIECFPRSHCNDYFTVLNHLFQNYLSRKTYSINYKSEENSINLKELIEFLMQKFLDLPICEKSISSEDFLLQGYLKLIENIISYNSDLLIILLENPLFLKNLFYGTLFEKPAKIKSPNSMKSIFSLISRLLFSIENITVSSFLNFLIEMLKKPQWRTFEKSDYSISIFSAEKSSTGFVGLKNLGCTCYMNSLIQQFFMIEEFREIVLEIDDGIIEDNNDDLLFQFQKVLGGLKCSEKQYFDPKGLCYAYKDINGKSVNVLEQMDADEFCNNFLDKLEKQLKVLN